MRKVLSFITAISLVIGIGSAINVEEVNAAQLVSVKVDGKGVNFPDAKPFINTDGRTIVPGRFVFEAMGATVDWEEQNQLITIIKGSKQIVMQIGQNWAIEHDINEDKRLTFDTKPVLITDNGETRTYIPLRFVSETFGAGVAWDDVNKLAIIRTDGTVENVPTPTPTPVLTKQPIKYIDIKPEEIPYPEVIEIAKLENVSYVAAVGPEKSRTRQIEVSFGEKNPRNNNDRNGVFSVNIEKGSKEFITIYLSKYDDLVLDRLKKSLAILYPDDADFQNTLYETTVNYRGVSGFKMLDLKAGYDVYIDQTLPINDEGTWGRDAFNVWLKVIKK
ncbi:MAG: Protease inhibitor precursor [Clostridiales bacterium]|jgi:hypothetical protein|nr:Protease inhibitor precursor [Clostridiales bacterium]